MNDNKLNTPKNKIRINKAIANLFNDYFIDKIKPTAARATVTNHILQQGFDGCGSQLTYTYI